jgi:hypothetical protein
VALPFHVFVFYETADNHAVEHASFLCEGGRTWDLDQKWSVRLDRAHHPNMFDHVHILLRGNDVCVLNRDGTPSHQTTTNAVPRWVMDDIRARKLIESSALLEKASADFALWADRIVRAERRAKMMDALDYILGQRRRLRFHEWLRR